MNSRTFLIAGIGAANLLLLSGCASSPRTEVPRIAEQELRSENLDVLFATEFPVASRGEALAHANAAMQTGDFERGLFYYVKALKFQPDDAALLVRIGQVHEYRHDIEHAVRAYTLALRSDPDNVLALEGRGLLLLANGEALYAEADLRRAVSVEVSAWRAHNGLGLLADAEGEHATAIGHYTSALALQPGSPMLLNNRGYSSLLAGRPKEAEADLRAAAGMGYERAWINLGVVLASDRRYEEAVAAFSEVLSEAEAMNKAGATALENSDVVIAERLFKSAIEASPVYFPAAEENLAQVARTG